MESRVRAIVDRTDSVRTLGVRVRLYIFYDIHGFIYRFRFGWFAIHILVIQ